MRDYVINFVVFLNPNGRTVLSWPKYDTSSAPKQLVFQDGLFKPPLAIINDDYRKEGMDYLTSVTLANPL